MIDNTKLGTSAFLRDPMTHEHTKGPRIMPMQAFKNDPALKQMYLDRVQAHIDADELVRGQTGQNGKGCSIWCTFDYYDHARAARETDVPEWLWRLNDTLYEGMSVEKSHTWPLVFIAAARVGADLDAIKGPFLIFILTRVLTRFDHAKFPEVAAAVKGSIALWQRDNIGSDDRLAAAWAARARAAEAEARARAWEAEAWARAGEAAEAGVWAWEAESWARAAAEAAWAWAAAAWAAGAWAAEAEAAEATAGAWAWALATRAVAATTAAVEYDVFADHLLELMAQA